MEAYPASVPATPATTSANVPAKRPGSFSNLPDWDGKDRPRDPATGQFVAKQSDAAIAAHLGVVPEVAAVLASQPGGPEAGANNLVTSMTRIWGSDAQQVAEWALS